MDRTILHCDCNSFFASVETAINPSYRDVPMAVCGSQEDRHGIVLAKNEKAKKYGVQTAETVFSAKRKCPSLVIASPHYDQYERYSKMVNAIYAEYTDKVEPFGIDESWLDVTASRRIFGSGEEIAELIRQRIKKEIGITVSIGVSFNKVFAKLGSDYKKPDAITVISRDNFEQIVYPLPVSDLLFVGKRTSEELLRIGVKTIGDLANTSKDMLRHRFGKMGEMLSDYANGRDESPVGADENHEVKSISNGFTFRHDLLTREECRTGIDFLCEEIGARLRSKSLKCNTVALTIKDTRLKTIQRQRPLKNASDINREISALAYEILCDEWSENIPIRMLTVSVTGLVDTSSSFTQLDLFAEVDGTARDKDKKREETVDAIRKRFGSSAISSGAFYDTDIGVSVKKK